MANTLANDRLRGGRPTSHPRQTGRAFGDSYSRWQVRVPDQVSTAGMVTFLNGLILVSETSTSGSTSDRLPGGHWEGSLDKRFRIRSGGIREPLAGGNLP